MATKPKVGQIAQKQARWVDADPADFEWAGIADAPVARSTAEPAAPEQDGPMARGVKQVSASVGLAGRLAARDFDGAAKNISDQAAYRAANPGSEEAQGLRRAWQQGDGIWGGIKGVAGEIADDYRRADGVGAGVMSVGRNLQAMGSGLVEQVPNMALPMAGMLGGGAAGSAAAGPIGTVAGGWAGASAGNALVGTSEAAFRQLEKAGVNPSDAAAVREYLANNGDAILGETAIKGGVIGAVDVATAGLAHWLLSGPGKVATTKALTEMGVDMADKAAVKAATKTPVFKNLIANDATYQATQVGAQKLLRNTGAAATEPVGEFAGEYGGSLAATGEADAKDAFLEAASSLGQSGIMFAGQKAIQAIKSPSQAAADTIRATEKVPESGALTRAMNAGVEAKAQAVEAGGLQLAPLVVEQTATATNGLALEPLPGESAPEPVDDPVRDQILALPDGARQDALRAYAVVNRTDVANGVQQYNRKLLDRLLAENKPEPEPAPEIGGVIRTFDPASPPVSPLSLAPMGGNVYDNGIDFQSDSQAELASRSAELDRLTQRAPRTRTDGVDLDLQADPVLNYLDNLRGVNTPAARAYVRDFDAGRITPADVQQRMVVEQGVTPDQRIARAAAEAPATADPVADRLRQAVSQRATPAPTDILNPAGEPFKTRMAADRAAKKTPGAVVPVEGGFVVRPQEPVNVQDVPQAPEVPQAAPAISQPAQAQEAVGAQPAGPAAGVPAEGAGAVEAAGVSVQLEDALFKERDATTSAIENDWMNGNGRRRLTNIERAIYDAVTASTLDADSAAQIIETALENDRPDLAQYAASRAMRAAKSMDTTPGVPQSSPKYGKIKSDLEASKKQALDAASALQEIVNSKQAPQAVAGVVDATPGATPIVEVQDNYGRTHRVRQSDLYSNADRIPTVRQNGEVVAGEEIPRSIVKDAPTIPLAQQGAFDGGRRLEADAGNDTAAAGAVPAQGNPAAGEPAATGAGGEMLDALDGRPGASAAPAGDVAGPAAPAVGAPLDALQNQAAAPVAQAQEAAKGVANQPITRAQVDSAVQQASSAVGARIDAMSAQEVQKIAARFLQTMGVRVPAGKARIKEAVTSAGQRMNWAAAAAEFGADLPQDAMSALQADVEGRVQEGPVEALTTPAGVNAGAALTASPVRIGRDQTPLSEGGKPFKTRKAAGDAKKLQPMMRVVTVPGGYALADKTPAQLAAEAKAAKRLATPRTSARGEPIPAHAFVAAAGGLNPVAASDLGVDGNPRIGNRRLFSGQGRGLSMDQATQMLIQDGYLSEGATINDALALIKKSLTQPQYNADGIERIAQAEADAQFEDYLAAQEDAAVENDEFDPFGPAPTVLDGFSDDMLESSGYDSATDAIKAEVRALLEMANAQGIDTESIMLEAHEQTRNATEQDYYEAAKSALEAAIAGSNRDRGTPAGGEGQGPGAAATSAAATSAAEQGLNQPVALNQQAQAATESVAPEALELAAQTPAEAAARQAAQEQAAKAEAAAKRAADAAAAKEEDRKRIAQASVRAADRFELGQDPLDSLTGQGSMFDDAPAPALSIPEGYKPAGEPFYRDGKQIQGYAPFAPGERVKMKESAGQAGVVESLTSPDDAGVFSGAMVKFDNGSTQIVKFEKLDAAAKPSESEQRSAAVSEAARKIAETVSFYGLQGKSDFGMALLRLIEGSTSSRALGRFPTKGKVSDPQRKKALSLADAGKLPVAAAVVLDRQGVPIAGVYLQLPFADPRTDDFWNRRVLEDIGAVGEVVYPSGAWTNKPASTVTEPALESASSTASSPVVSHATRTSDAKSATGSGLQSQQNKLTPAEAKSLMAWEDLGQKDGVKTHALTFYESQADKDAKRGRMIVAKVSKGDRSANAWMVDGEDKTFGALAQAKKLAEEVGMARAVADGFVEPAAAKPAADPQPAAPAAKPAPAAATIKDAGEKIGGARKDRWKERGLNLDDLDAMTEAEGAELATKANVWKPDYDALAEASEPVTAAMVKTIYDQLAAKPKKNTPEGRRQYVQMMRIVRDVLTEAKGPEAVRNAYLEIRKRAGLNTMDPKAKEVARGLLFSVYKGRSDPFVLGGADLMKAKKMVEDGFPAKAAPWKSRLTVGRREGGNGVTERGIEMYMELSADVGTPLSREQIEAGFFRVVDKQNKTVAFAPTKEDAEAAAETVYERDLKGKKDSKPEPVRPNLDELKRENLPQRIDRDVTSDDFVRDLGFRGVEFGLWSAQDERQRILNMAYDGLMDLAEIMGVPPKAMSLNGTLGMAFGARGGGRFAAHYEPGKLVINMTKIRGGGSMAHEWAHALDHYFGELDKADAYTTQARGASGWYAEDQYVGVPRKRMERVGNEWKSVEKMRLDNLRPEMAAAFDEVMRALFSKQITKAEMVRSHELDLERTEAMARNETQADLKAMYQNMAQNKRQALNELRGDPEGTMYAGRGRSDYASQAQALSGKSENGYWTRPTEMFARAFESWVFDRVTAMGARSDYLVHGVEEERFAGGAYKGNPYPTGEERARINAAFDKLAGTIKTKDTDKGVAMFSRTTAEIERDIASATEQAVKQWLSSLRSAATNLEAKEPSMATPAVLRILGAKAAKLVLPRTYLRAILEKHGDVPSSVFENLPALLADPLFIIPHKDGGLRVFIEAQTAKGEPIAVGVSVDAGGRIQTVTPLHNQDDLSGQERMMNFVANATGKIYSRNGEAPITMGASSVAAPATIALHRDSIRRRSVITRADVVNRIAQSSKPGDPRFSFAGESTPPADSNARNVATQLLIDGLKAKWTRAPEIIVARNMQDAQIPQEVRDYDALLKSQGATGEPRGFIYKGKVYLLSDQLKGPQQIAEVLFHEVLGHYGLRGAFGDGLTPILKQLGALRRKEVVAKAREYGLFNKDALGGLDKAAASDSQIWTAMSNKQRLDAAEEVLAEMAQTQPNIGFVQRAIAAIRNWLRANVPGFKNLKLTDADIVQAYILPARAYVTRSNETVQQAIDRAMGDAGFSRTAGDQTQTENFRRWFAGSKVVDAQGKPLVVYHGTTKDFNKFDDKFGRYSTWQQRIKRKLGLPSTDGEFFFAANPDFASKYAGVDGALQGGNIMPVFLSIKSPATYEQGVTPGSLADAIARAKADGKDGILVRNWNEALAPVSDVFIAFDAKQIKSAIGNNGDFDPANPDIRFSRTTDAAKAVGDAIKSVTVTNIKQRAGFKLTDYLGIGLQTLGRRQIVDIYGDLLPLAEYNRLVQQMEADKNEGGAEADQLVTRWAKLDDEAKLADLMHDATLAQIDPAEDFVEGDDKGKYLELQRKYNLLSDGAKKVYADTRDSYKAHHAKVRSAIKERIERSEIKGERKAALLKQMDNEFFKAIKGVYFPLARFGQYAVTVKGPDGKVESVSRAETKAEAEALRNNLLSAFPRDKGFTVGRVMLSKDFIADRDAVGRGFMTELYQVLDKQDMDAAQRAELEDTLGQLYLSSLPDLSWAKHGIHRKGTPGFSQDARRAFAQNMFHGARYLAKLRYSDLMQDELAAMQKHVDDWREVEDFDQNSAQRVVDEMNKRHESLMNPKSNPLSTALTSLGFVFHLGLSPASAMVNLSQTALVAYPIMGAKWGFGKASAALLKASAEAAKGKNDITASLNADERAAYDEAVRAGTIDVTMAHDLAGIAQGEDAGVMWKIRPVMRWASFLFHHAERFNRQVTFVAAYRLAREAGADHKAAFEQATKATYDGHFDYGAANRPRIMQGNVAKVLLLFKQYGQNMVYTLARNAQQAIKGESPEVRAQARKALGGLLATHAAAAGVLGLPMVTTLLAAASMIGGDDDEPWDAKVALQNMLADTLGQKPAEVLAHGLSRLTPWDISGRVGLDKLIFPDVQEGLEGRRLGEAAMAAALGPVAGIGINVLKGLQDMSQGQYARGLEAMMPAALRGPIKAIRYESEGVQDKTGVVIKDEVSLAGVAGQFLGFSPSEVRNATEGKSAVIQQDRALGERRQELLTKAARATMAKDAEARAEAMKEIERFNQKNPTRRITPLNVLQSVRNRQKRIDQAEGGVYLPKNRRDAMEAGRFAVAE